MVFHWLASMSIIVRYGNKLAVRLGCYGNGIKVEHSA